MTQDITLSFSIEEMRAFLEKLGYETGTFLGNPNDSDFVYTAWKSGVESKCSPKLHIVFTKELKAKLLNL